MSEVRKISVSMPAEVIERVRLAADATGQSVSAWLTDAATARLDEQARLAIGRVAAENLVADYEAEHGPLPAEIVADVDSFFAEIAEARGGHDGGGDDGRGDAVRRAG